LIEDIELRAERVVIRHADWIEDVVLPDPRDLHFQEVLLLLRDWDFEGLRHKKISIYGIEEIMRVWRAAYDLPEINASIRLAYLVDHYYEDLDADLRKHLGVDIDELWHSRRWGRLLGYINRLPSHTWYSQTVSQDEEHTALLAKQLAEQSINEGEKKEAAAPPISTWTPEAALLSDVLDAVNKVTHAVLSTNAGKSVEAAPPAPRPNADLAKMVEREKLRIRKEKHEALAARMLRNR
jgi:hypothetical protein